MALLSGAISATRYRVAAAPATPEFDARAFAPLPRGSERTEAIGFLPAEPEAPYEIGARRFFFRVRFDQLRPDPTAVGERLKELLRAELAGSGLQFVGSRRRSELREQAREEIQRQTAPRSRIVEGVLDGPQLFLGTTAKAHLGRVLLLLREIGVLADSGAPWIAAEEDEPQHSFLAAREPGQSVRGAAFLHLLIEEGELIPEPLKGAVRLQTPDATVTLGGAVLPELDRLLAAGAEPLAARLVAGDLRFRLDALAWQVSGLAVPGEKRGHWTEVLDARLATLSGLFELLDARYEALRPGIAERLAGGPGA